MNNLINDWGKFIISRLEDYLAVYEPITGSTVRTRNSRELIKIINQLLDDNKKILNDKCTTYALCKKCGDTNDHYMTDNLYEDRKRICLTCGEPIRI